jgi:hypothetical protein
MLELREHTQSRGIEFRLKNVTRLVCRVLEITRLNSVFDVTPKLEDLPRVSRRLCMSTTKFASCA